ncbi:MAG: hypothetical protein U5J83_17750 [Bryobacterales bacterium]|nr:hypothetical protein [Bryobacterales bacterium]
MTAIAKAKKKTDRTSASTIADLCGNLIRFFISRLVPTAGISFAYPGAARPLFAWRAVRGV